MATSIRSKVLTLYKQLLKEGQQLQDYNFRSYAKRRVIDAFRDNKSETDPQQIEKLLLKAESNLEVIKRQVLVGKLYGRGKLVIE